MKTTEDQLQSLFKKALNFCRYHGWPVNDPEYASAINMAVWKAAKAYEARTRRTYTLQQMVNLFSIRACSRASRDYKAWMDRQCIHPRSISVKMKVTISKVATDLTDESLLTFVAAVGRWKASVLLQVHPYTLDSLLDEAVLRLKTRIENEDTVNLDMLSTGGGRRINHTSNEDIDEAGCHEGAHLTLRAKREDS